MVRATALLIAFLMSSAVHATECRLALALALDISSSVDADEDALQRTGLAAALRAPEVKAAFFATEQHVALAVYEWSGRYNQELLLDWTIIDTPAKLKNVSGFLATTTRSHNEFATAMGQALAFGSQLFEHAPKCAGRTLDMAGDGQNNEGMNTAEAYATYAYDNITVNGLVVNGGDFEAEPGLVAFFKAEVLRGPGAFLEIAQGFKDYERAMRRKLEREVSPPVIGAISAMQDAS